MKRLFLLQLSSVIIMLIGLIFLILYQKLAKEELKKMTNFQKKSIKNKETIYLSLGLILETIGLLILIFI